MHVYQQAGTHHETGQSGRARTQSTAHVLTCSTPSTAGTGKLKNRVYRNPDFNTHPSKARAQCTECANYLKITPHWRYSPGFARYSRPHRRRHTTTTHAYEKEASRMYGGCATAQRKLHRRTNTRTSLVDRQDKPNRHALKPDSPSISERRQVHTGSAVAIDLRRQYHTPLGRACSSIS